MPSKFLFGAEADKIQDTLFRAGRQRQVVGGSRLLTEFGDVARELAGKYGAAKADVLINAGGSFRILFPSATAAQEFGRDLAESYRLLLDASLTCTDPPLAVNGNFDQANHAIGESIRRLKGSPRGETDPAHAPTTAFCQASGVGLAGMHDYDYSAPSRARTADKKYLSHFASRMGTAGKDLKTQDAFLSPIRKLLPPSYRSYQWADDVDEIAKYDGERGNVAYLIADGNNMGELFGECDAAQLVALSVELEKAMRRAVGFPLPHLATRLSAKKTLPALPLILAGDDAFVLLPAPYALDAAQQFCLTFERELRTSAFSELRAKAQARAEKYLPPPTMSAVVIICKSHYPYHLAHQRGEELLKQVKQLVKTVGVHNDDASWRSAIAFNMIIGSELVAVREETRNAPYRSSLGVYWATNSYGAEGAPEMTQGLTQNAQRAALPIQDLIDQRRALKDLPAKRLEQVRELYAPEALARNEGELKDAWVPRLEKLLDRVAATQPAKSKNVTSKKDSLQTLKDALSALGNSDAQSDIGYWREVKRPGQALFFAHGLPDLIEVWNYAQSLACSLDAYRVEE